MDMRLSSPPRYHIMLVKESGARVEDVRIRDSQTAYRLLKPLFDGLDREHFMVVGLDAKHAVIGINTVSIGSVTLSIVHPREVFKPTAVQNNPPFSILPASMLRVRRRSI
jgi:DNA repair protein RadC